MIRIPKNPTITWERLWNILIDYIDNDLEGGADPDYAREMLQEICTKEELKELGIWNWLDMGDDE